LLDSCTFVRGSSCTSDASTGITSCSSKDDSNVGVARFAGVFPSQ
jgi:hypothetical protein